MKVNRIKDSNNEFYIPKAIDDIHRILHRGHFTEFLLSVTLFNQQKSVSNSQPFKMNANHEIRPQFVRKHFVIWSRDEHCERLLLPSVYSGKHPIQIHRTHIMRRSLGLSLFSPPMLMSPSRYGPGLLTPPSMSALPTNQLLHHSQITSLTNSMVHHHTAMTNGLNGLTNNNSLNTNNNHHGDIHASNNNVKSMVSSNNSSSGSIPPSSPNNMTRSLTPGKILIAKTTIDVL